VHAACLKHSVLIVVEKKKYKMHIVVEKKNIYNATSGG
jgi:hypothetical protein